jgi:hypothetical protein
LSEKLSLGDQLDVDTSYIRAAADTISEISVKLTQVLWRKILPSDSKEADQSLTEITYNLIERKKYKLAINLLDFGFGTIKRFSSAEHRLRMLVTRHETVRSGGP